VRPRWVLGAAVVLAGLLTACGPRPLPPPGVLPEREEGGAGEQEVFPPEERERGPWQPAIRMAGAASDRRPPAVG